MGEPRLPCKTKTTDEKMRSVTVVVIDFLMSYLLIEIQSLKINDEKLFSPCVKHTGSEHN